MFFIISTYPFKSLILAAKKTNNEIETFFFISNIYGFRRTMFGYYFWRLD